MVLSSLPRPIAGAGLLLCALTAGLLIGPASRPACAAAAAPGPYPAIPAESLAIIDRLPDAQKALYSVERAPRLLPAYVPAVGETAKTWADRRFDQIVDAWFAQEALERPTFATNAGLHDYDLRLEETSRASILKRASARATTRSRRENLEPGHLSPSRRLDHASFTARMQGIEHDLGTIRGWENNPNYYSGVLSNGVFALVKRDYAPADVRMKAANARLAEAKRILADARLNLKTPPRIQTEIAIAQGKGLVSFLKDVVPPQVKAATDAGAKAEFEKVNAKAIAEVESYVAWLQSDLLPRSSGVYSIGRDAYQAKLLYDEGVGTPVDELLALGYQKLAETHTRMIAVAKKIDPDKSPADVLAETAKDHPASDQLLPATREGLDRIRQFIEDKKICTAPPNQNLLVAETPVFARSTSFASMDSPGIYEQNANEAYYNVTPADAEWPKEKQDEHLGLLQQVAARDRLDPRGVSGALLPVPAPEARAVAGAASSSARARIPKAGRTIARRWRSRRATATATRATTSPCSTSRSSASGATSSASRCTSTTGRSSAAPSSSRTSATWRTSTPSARRAAARPIRRTWCTRSASGRSRSCAKT